MRIEVPAEDVYARGQSILSLVRPLARNPKDLYTKFDSNAQEVAIAVLRGGHVAQGGYKWHRFETTAAGFSAMYHERWKRFLSNRNEYYYLFKAYLHIYQIDASLKKEQEFLLLHCDPNEPDTASHAAYKQSPHIHIECRKAPWPHGAIWPRAHLALNVGYNDQVLKDIRSLTEALSAAITMLRDQVLDRLPSRR